MNRAENAWTGAEPPSVPPTGDDAIPSEWRADFAAAAARPLAQRVKYAFVRTYKPVLDDAPFRAFDSMRDYREWCERSLPRWLGYHR